MPRGVLDARGRFTTAVDAGEYSASLAFPDLGLSVEAESVALVTVGDEAGDNAELSITMTGATVGGNRTRWDLGPAGGADRDGN